MSQSVRILVLKRSVVFYRSAGHAVTGQPRTGNAPLEHAGENRVAERSGSRDQNGHVSFPDPQIQECFVTGAIHTMDRLPCRPKTLDPNRCIERAVRITIHTDRNHAVTLDRPFVEMCLMFITRDTVIGVESRTRTGDLGP